MMQGQEKNSSSHATPTAGAAMARGDDGPTGTPGTGEAICRDCGGSGRDTERRLCNACAGTGKVNVGIGGA